MQSLELKGKKKIKEPYISKGTFLTFYLISFYSFPTHPHVDIKKPSRLVTSQWHLQSFIYVKRVWVTPSDA